MEGMSGLMIERLDIVISSTLVVVVEGRCFVVIGIKVGDIESIDIIDLDHPEGRFPEEVLRRAIAERPEEDKLLDGMALSEALGSYLLVDFEEGIAHEVEVLQCLSLRGWPELIEVTRQAILIVVADIYIELLPEVVLDVLLDLGHRRRIQR